MAQGRREEAGKQYLEAFANVEPGEKSNEASALALKLDNLGITPPSTNDTTVITP
jgi:predicted negative regulator of RcsB-dependent stress response